MNILERRISSKNLYLITLKQVSSLSVGPLRISFYPIGNDQHAFAKKEMNGYRDVFTKKLYHTYDEPSLGSGDWIISKAEVVQSDYKFIPESILQEELANLNPGILSARQKQLTKKIGG